MKCRVGAMIAFIALILLFGGAALVVQAQEFGDDAFLRLWNEQDRIVAEQPGIRSWTWGPSDRITVLREDFDGIAGGKRTVQYFDKSRMEINDPSGDRSSQWFVTNGLLPIEMMTGKIQTGFNYPNEDFDFRGRARISAIGDPDNFPTYADLSAVYQSPGAVSADDLNEPVTNMLTTDGSLTSFTQFEDDPLTVLVQGENSHGVAQAFIDFQNQIGPVFDGNGNYVTQQVYANPTFVFGLPVSSAYWVMASVGGQEVPVMFQVFERRVLTYNPANDPAFRVEMGNVGQHYYQWRYEEQPTEPTTTPYPEP